MNCPVSRFREPLRRALWILVAMAACLTGLAGCRGARTPSLILAGSTSIQPYAEKWAEAYRANHGGEEIFVQGGGSTAGLVAVGSGTAHLGMCSRALKPEEAARFRSLPVARDAIAVVVHPENRLIGLRLEQVRQIFAGKMPNWRAAGGADAELTVITREEGSGTRAAFEELVMGGLELASSALVQDSSGALRQMVSQDPNAIGYMSVGQVDRSVRALTLDGSSPTEADIDAGSYKLVRPFLFVMKGEPGAPAKAFIDWITGPAGQLLTRREGLLPPSKGLTEAYGPVAEAAHAGSGGPR